MPDIFDRMREIARKDFIKNLSEEDAADIVEQEMRNGNFDTAQIWLDPDGDCVAISHAGGTDEVARLPFFIPEPFLPVRPSATSQVEECKREIEQLRRFAKEVSDMADLAETQLSDMLGKDG